jgi:hypothetical protein
MRAVFMSISPLLFWRGMHYEVRHYAGFPPSFQLCPNVQCSQHALIEKSSQCFSFSTRDRGSHPCNTRGEVSVLCARLPGTPDNSCKTVYDPGWDLSSFSRRSGFRWLCSTLRCLMTCQMLTSVSEERTAYMFTGKAAFNLFFLKFGSRRCSCSSPFKHSCYCYVDLPLSSTLLNNLYTLLAVHLWIFWVSRINSNYLHKQH